MFILWWEANISITETAKSILATFRMVAGQNSNRSKNKY